MLTIKRDRLIRLLVVVGIVASACGTSAARSVEEQVKELAEQYKQVEAQLGRSIHYMRKTESNGETTIEQAWYNGANNLIKVAVDRSVRKSQRRVGQIPCDSRYCIARWAVRHRHWTRA